MRLLYSMTDAAGRNCSLAMYPIPVHVTQNNGMTFRTWNDTFDIQILEEMVTLITPDQFHSSCSGIVAFRLCMSNFGLNYYDVITHIKLDTGLNFAKDSLSLKDSFTCQDFSDRKCVIDLHPPGLTIPETVFSHLKKAQYIRKIVDDAINVVCNGKPYLTVHWRNRTGERCTLWRHERRECTYDFLNLVNVEGSLLSAVRSFMHQESLQCLYVAFPSYSKKIMEILGRGIPSLYSKDDIISSVPSIATYKDDNYVISLVEQDIAIRGAAFLGCLGSAWSDMTSKSRVAEGKMTTWLKLLPGIPEDVHLVN